jgi:preprotein translocase subunit YajC
MISHFDVPFVVASVVRTLRRSRKALPETSFRVGYAFRPTRAERVGRVAPERLHSMLLLFALLAQEEGQKTGGGSGSIMMLLMIMAAGFFILVLPMRRQKKQQENLLSNLKVKDKVITSAGIIGVIFSIPEKKDEEVKEDEVILKVDDNAGTRIRVLKSSIVRVYPAAVPGQSGDKK